MAFVAAAALLPLAASGHENTDDLTACEAATNPAQAISICTRVIESGTTSKLDQAIGYLYRGVAYQDTGDGVRAMQDLDAAVEAAPSDPMIIANRGATHSRRHNL
jgi:hypothetical protein